MSVSSSLRYASLLSPSKPWSRYRYHVHDSDGYIYSREKSFHFLQPLWEIHFAPSRVYQMPDLDSCKWVYEKRKERQRKNPPDFGRISLKNLNLTKQLLNIFLRFQREVYLPWERGTVSLLPLLAHGLLYSKGTKWDLAKNHSFLEVSLSSQRD